MSPSSNKNEKVLSLDLTKQSIVLNKIDITQPNKKDIRRPLIKKLIDMLLIFITRRMT